AVLDTLVESLPGAPVLLLVSYRPDYQHAWASKTFYRQVRLDPLPPASTAELLGALVGTHPSLADLTEGWVRRGNPFFLEESVRMLVDTRALVGDRGAYSLTQPLQTLRVPATIETIVTARVDRLP